MTWGQKSEEREVRKLRVIRGFKKEGTAREDNGVSSWSGAWWFSSQGVSSWNFSLLTLNPLNSHPFLMVKDSDIGNWHIFHSCCWKHPTIVIETTKNWQRHLNTPSQMMMETQLSPYCSFSSLPQSQNSALHCCSQWTNPSVGAAGWE